jgi:hypothetical protein
VAVVDDDDDAAISWAATLTGHRKPKKSRQAQSESQFLKHIQIFPMK